MVRIIILLILSTLPGCAHIIPYGYPGPFEPGHRNKPYTLDAPHSDFNNWSGKFRSLSCVYNSNWLVYNDENGVVAERPLASPMKKEGTGEFTKEVMVIKSGKMNRSGVKVRYLTYTNPHNERVSIFLTKGRLEHHKEFELDEFHRLKGFYRMRGELYIDNRRTSGMIPCWALRV